MLIGTFFYSVIRLWLQICKMILLNPIFVIKVSFLWFSMAFAASYIFFLIVHKSDVLFVRKHMAMELARSLVYGFFIASMFAAIYEFVLFNVMHSQFFQAQQSFVQSLSFLGQDPCNLYKRLCFLMVIMSGFFAAHYVGDMLDTWYERHISNRYGWVILLTTLLCWGFLWAVVCVI